MMSLLEPQAPDSLAAWGFFAAAFERKEYMEDYVAEDVAREMLARDPALRERFERKLKDDSAFAADPQALAFVFHEIDQMQKAKFKPVVADWVDYNRPFAIAGLVLVGLFGMAQFGLRFSPW